MFMFCLVLQSTSIDVNGLPRVLSNFTVYCTISKYTVTHNIHCSENFTVDKILLILLIK